jgi:mitochondrial fission protein ELM1
LRKVVQGVRFLPSFFQIEKRREKPYTLYIGETQQLLHTRIKNHRTSEASVSNKHILTCSINATNKEKLNYFEEHLSIIEKKIVTQKY